MNGVGYRAALADDAAGCQGRAGRVFPCGWILLEQNSRRMSLATGDRWHASAATEDGLAQYQRWHDRLETHVGRPKVYRSCAMRAADRCARTDPVRRSERPWHDVVSGGQGGARTCGCSSAALTPTSQRAAAPVESYPSGAALGAGTGRPNTNDGTIKRWPVCAWQAGGSC